MPRPPRSDGKQQVYLYTCKGYRYASTQPMETDLKTGRKKLTRILWGRLSEDLVFTPNKTFLLADEQTRLSLDFPSDWNLSALAGLQDDGSAEAAVAKDRRGRPSYDGVDVNRLYGDVWLLEQICERTGLYADLLKVFGGDREKIADLLTLAIFPYLTGYTYNRVERWQRIAKGPSKRTLSPEAITKFMQSLTEKNRMDLFRLRKGRLANEEFLAVDSTSRSCHGNSLSSVRWGKNKEGDKLRQTNELVVYGLASHMPVYYRQFPGNMPDTRSVDVLLTDLSHAGFGKVPLLMDRGYSSVASMEMLLAKGHPFIMCTKVGWSLVGGVIDSLGIRGDGTRPPCFTLDPRYKLYHYQQEIPYSIMRNGGREESLEGLMLNLYYDPVRRGQDIIELDIDRHDQERDLAAIVSEQLAVTPKEAKKFFPYHRVVFDGQQNHIVSYSLDQNALDKAIRLSGFIAIISYGIKGDSKRIWDIYHLRDEQEKLFSQMKTQIAARRTRAWSEEAHEGRLLVLFVALTFSSHLRHIWKTTPLYDQFSSSLEILDEMRSIRCIEHTGKAKKITPFIGKQRDICEAFGVAIPKGCEPAGKQKKKPGKKTTKP